MISVELYTIRNSYNDLRDLKCLSKVIQEQNKEQGITLIQ